MRRRSWQLGGASRDRTGDLKLAKLALSQLSYGPSAVRQWIPGSAFGGPRMTRNGSGFFASTVHCPLSSDDCSVLGPRSSVFWNAGHLCGHLAGEVTSLKEVIQPHLPIRLPCYDFTPVMNHSVGVVPLAVRLTPSGAAHFHGVTGGVYKARERIHRSVLICDY